MSLDTTPSAQDRDVWSPTSPYRLPAVFPLLLAVTTDSAADTAIRLTRVLAQECGAVPTVVHVANQSPDLLPKGVPSIGSVRDDELIAEYRDKPLDAIESQLRHAIGLLPSWHIEVLAGQPVDVIVHQARLSGAELIVLGFPPHSAWWRSFMRSTVQGVVREGHAPILAVHPALNGRPKRAMVALDFSPSSLRAASLAREVLAPDGHIELVYVRPFQATTAVDESSALLREVELDEVLSMVMKDLRPTQDLTISATIREGSAPAVLHALGEQLAPDLIAFGAAHRSQVDWFFGDTVSTNLIDSHQCSLLVVPEEGSTRV